SRPCPSSGTSSPFQTIHSLVSAPSWRRHSSRRRSASSPRPAITRRRGRRFLHLRSRNEHSTIVRDIAGQMSLAETPILEWTWRATILPTGGDLRRKETTDLAAQLYVVWPRVPAWLRSRIIGYVWDTTTPVGTIAKSQKTGTVTLIVLRSGSAELGQWL